ncbi:MAG: hypothetical protein ABEK02_01570 [Haloquadratum sp.]
MTDEMPAENPDATPGSISEGSIPEDRSSRRSLAERLAARADDDPDGLTRDEMAQIVALVSSDDTETRVDAAEALQHLHERPELFAPFVADILDASATYPDDVDSMPAPVQWMGSPALRAILYAADALARVARDRPDLIVPHADRFREVLRADRPTPRYHLFALGYAEASEPGTVPRAWLKGELCDLLDHGYGNGYPSWAADVLRRLGDPDVLPTLREKRPDETRDEATREAFADAIGELEAAADR